MRRALATSAFVALSLTAAVDGAAAPGATSSLSWVELEGAETCGGAAALAQAVEARLGRHALVSPAQADLSIEGHVERTGSPPHLRAVLTMRGASGAVLGTRELASGELDCTQLRSEVALAVALMIDPDAALHPAPPAAPPPPVVVERRVEVMVPGPPGPPPPPVVVERRVEVTVPGPPEAPSAPWAVEPSVSAALGTGLLPSLAVGARLDVTVLPAHLWPVEIFGGAWGAQRVASEEGTSTRFSSTFAGLALCPLHTPKDRPLSFDLCAGATVAVIGSVGAGFVASTSESKPAVYATIDGHLVFRLVGPVAARLGGTLALALVWNDYVYADSQGTQTDFAPSRLAATADLGVAVTLP